jgi:polyisoprenoid-binding protein YceI
MTQKSSLLKFGLAGCLLAALAASPQERPIDPATSKLTVRAFKTGLFSGLADNHEIDAPIAEGSIDEAAGHVMFSVESQRMKVLDPQMNPSRRQEVQQRMLGPEVLDSTHFPEITFESTSVERPSKGAFLVHGQLSLHGTTKPVEVKVRTENGGYQGTCTLKQRDFGITPISIAGGTVKVKDELQIEFEIHTAATAVASPK